MRAIFGALALLPALAMAAEALVSDLDQRLRTTGVESVNAYLGARPSAMAELNQGAADCEPRAIDLTVKLSRSSDTKAAALHTESLRIAVGTCTELVLSQLSQNEVPKVCAAAVSWTMSQTARELRRRIRQIEADEQSRPTQWGTACSAAYLHELQNTRVGIRAGRATPPPCPREPPPRGCRARRRQRRGRPAARGWSREWRAGRGKGCRRGPAAGSAP